MEKNEKKTQETKNKNKLKNQIVSHELFFINNAIFSGSSLFYYLFLS